MRSRRLVALLLLGMSVASWVVILWKAWLLPRARTDVARQRCRVLAIGVAGDARSACRHLTGRRWCCR
jgi:biopolymer transport protein ExbB/TolQ